MFDLSIIIRAATIDDFLKAFQQSFHNFTQTKVNLQIPSFVQTTPQNQYTFSLLKKAANPYI